MFKFPGNPWPVRVQHLVGEEAREPDLDHLGVVGLGGQGAGERGLKGSGYRVQGNGGFRMQRGYRTHNTWIVEVTWLSHTATCAE